MLTADSRRLSVWHTRYSLQTRMSSYDNVCVCLYLNQRKREERVSTHKHTYQFQQSSLFYGSYTTKTHTFD